MHTICVPLDQFFPLLSRLRASMVTVMSREAATLTKPALHVSCHALHPISSSMGSNGSSHLTEFEQRFLRGETSLRHSLHPAVTSSAITHHTKREISTSLAAPRGSCLQKKKNLNTSSVSKSRTPPRRPATSFPSPRRRELAILHGKSRPMSHSPTLPSVVPDRPRLKRTQIHESHEGHIT